MGFLTKLFGKKNRNEDIPAEELPAEQAGEDPDGEGALTAEEEAAAEAAEQAVFCGASGDCRGRHPGRGTETGAGATGAGSRRGSGECR